MFDGKKDGLSEELIEQKYELTKERMRLRDERRAINDRLRSAARLDHRLDYLGELIESNGHASFGNIQLPEQRTINRRKADITSGLPATLPARIFDIRFIAPANSIAGNSLKLVTEGSVISIKMINGKAVPANIWAKGSVVQLSINNTGTTPTATLSGGGGSSGHLVSATAPDDTSVLWIDSANGYFAKIWDGSKWVGISAAWG